MEQYAMTEQAKESPSTAPLSPEANQAPQADFAPMTPEQFAVVKKSLIDNLQKAYDAFVKAVGRIPCHRHHNRMAFENFDTGFIWLEKGISQLPIEALSPPKPSSPQPEAQPQSSEAQAAPQAPEAPAPQVDQPLDAA
jgi:hypothetical protein